MTRHSDPAQPLASKLIAGRVLLVALALAGGAIGGWAEAAPVSFYRSFPGFGRHWLPPLGPFNEHLVRDFGGLNLGLAAAALIASITLTRSATATASAAWLGWSASVPSALAPGVSSGIQ